MKTTKDEKDEEDDEMIEIAYEYNVYENEDVEYRIEYLNFIKN